ncbi:GspH/FimT family pseudopilin [Shewanella sp. GXUN23E]|uniref:GspH/FimT family pseudopilin n=1 Tax=Shewanella sp. GXUN23E TaxID=3422498 RepID=UPI003D7D71FE
MMNRYVGFTLVEVMITLTIAMVLMMVAVPNMGKTYDFYRADSQINTVQDFLIAARNQAISYGTRITVCPVSANSCSNDWSLGLTMFIDNGNGNEIDGDDRILQVIGPFPAKDTVSYSRSSIRFLPTGLASGTNGTFRYCPSSKTSTQSLSLVVNNAGRVRDGEGPVICQ